AQNRSGPVVLGELPELAQYSANQLHAALKQDAVILVDTRPHGEVHQGTVAGSLNIPGISKAASYAAWVIDPEVDIQQIVVLAQDAEEARAFHNHLIRVGIDTVTGFVTAFDGFELVCPERIAPDALGDCEFTMLVDVRNRSEYSAGHLPDALQLSGGRALWALDQLPKDERIVSYCQSGVRNSIVASALRRRGYDVVELEGSYAAWSAIPENTPVVPGR
ncbi:MAG: rhodanese-like domain-containing protein, partial [Microbacteriaceae bacterium]